jgi:hypothetical protein
VHVFCGLTTSGFQQGFGADAHIFIVSLKPARSMLTRSQQGMRPAATLPFPVMLVSSPPGNVAVPCHDWLKRLFQHPARLVSSKGVSPKGKQDSQWHKVLCLDARMLFSSHVMRQWSAAALRQCTANGKALSSCVTHGLNVAGSAACLASWGAPACAQPELVDIIGYL